MIDTNHTQSPVAGIGFENGERVLIQEFNYSEIDGDCSEDQGTVGRMEMLSAVLRLLDADRLDALSVGRRAIILNFLAHPSGTQADLTSRLGLNQSGVSRWMERVRADLEAMQNAQKAG